MNNDDPKDIKENSATTASTEVKSEKLKFGSLAPLNAAQIVTLLVGSTNSNSSYGGY